MIPLQPHGGSGLPNLTLDVLGVAAKGAYSVRRLSRSYTGACMQVTRASDSTTQDIGFSGDALDTAALATFCAGTTGYVSKWYDQSGNGHDLIQATQANMWRIYASGAVETKNSLPSLRAIDAVRGMQSASFTAYTGSQMIGNVVGVLSSSTAGVTSSPRYLSVSGSGNIDGNTQGVLLLGRDGGATALQNWQVNRNSNAAKATKAGVYGQLQQIQSVANDPGYTVQVDQGTPGSASSSIGAFAATRINMAHSGGGPFSCADQYISEMVLFFANLTTSQRTQINQAQKSYFATA